MFSPVESLNVELRAADETLVGNEDILRAVLSGCGDCIKILDLAGRLQFMSEGGKRVMEVEDFQLLKGCPWPDFWAGEGNASAMNAVETARNGKTARFKGGANTAKGNSRYWDVQVSPILGANGKPTHLLSISRDITSEWEAEIAAREAAERQNLLTEEMHHRINNTLALVGAIASQTIRGQDTDSAREAFISRLTTLADANKALLQTGWTNAPISEVVERALAPHHPGTDRVNAGGPDFLLPAKQALSLALAIHELATNATKYGAFSNDSGKIDVRWRTETAGDEPAFHFQWEEKGGPPVADRQPSRTGFGSRLLQRVLADDFGGKVRTRFDPSGFTCELRSPLGVLSGSI